MSKSTRPLFFFPPSPFLYSRIRDFGIFFVDWLDLFVIRYILVIALVLSYASHICPIALLYRTFSTQFFTSFHGSCSCNKYLVPF